MQTGWKKVKFTSKLEIIDSNKTFGFSLRFKYYSFSLLPRSSIWQSGWEASHTFETHQILEVLLAHITVNEAHILSFWPRWSKNTPENAFYKHLFYKSLQKWCKNHIVRAGRWDSKTLWECRIPMLSSVGLWLQCLGKGQGG